MKKVNRLLILLVVSFVCLMPFRAEANTVNDGTYDCLKNNQGASLYNTGAVLIYRGWHGNSISPSTNMIKAIPHINVINLTGQTLQFTQNTGVFATSTAIVGQVALMRENTPTQKFAFSFDLAGVGSDDYNSNPGPLGTMNGDSEWINGLNNAKSASDLVMKVGNHNFQIHTAWQSTPCSILENLGGNADLVTMALRDADSNKTASYCSDQNNINRGMVYLTGYTDPNGIPFEVFLVAGDRTNITFLVKYTN